LGQPFIYNISAVIEQFFGSEWGVILLKMPLWIYLLPSGDSLIGMKSQLVSDEISGSTVGRL
jgi:hypothetical protein